jgi:SSS family solute:Na+ symporter/sodium/pantothenate symporter
MKTLLPPWASAFLLVAAVAAAMSTISSVLMVIASSVVQDLAGSPSVGKTRLAVLVLGCVAPVMALNPPGIIVTIVGLSFSVIASVFTVPLLAGLYLAKPSRAGALAAMILSATTCVAWQMFFFRSTWIYPVVPGLFAALVAYGAVHAAERLPLLRKAAFMDEE